MGRTVIAEENALSYLLEIAQPDSYSIGLIIGQSTVNRDYVIHLARTPSLASKKVEEEGSPHNSDSEDEPEVPVIKTITEVNDSWVADHAKHVTRMLPGGMCVLGLFIAGPQTVLERTADVARLRALLGRVQRVLGSNRHVHSSPDKLILCFNSVTHKFLCKSIDPDKPGASVAEWKFSQEPTRWHQVDCRLDLQQMWPVSCDRSSVTIKTHCQEFLSRMEAAVDRSLCLLNGEVKSDTELLSAPPRKRHEAAEDEVRTLSAALYVATERSPLRAQACAGELSFLGSVASRVFLHQRATVAEAVQAVKQDVLRSLAARLELHCDSLIEEESGSPEERCTLHEPPRRVMVALPHCQVALSDYLFPGEGVQEALASLHELLDIKMAEQDVLQEVEAPADATEFYTGSAEAEAEADAEDEAAPEVASNPYSMLEAIIALSVFVLIASLAVQMLSQA